MRSIPLSARTSRESRNSMQSSKKPTPEQVDAATAHLTAPQHERYFFDGLENPNWIAPLRKRHFFSDPPQVEHVPGGGLRCRPWAQSRYLVRMARLAPEEVASTLVDLKTDNWI